MWWLHIGIVSSTIIVLGCYLRYANVVKGVHRIKPRDAKSAETHNNESNTVTTVTMAKMVTTVPVITTVATDDHVTVEMSFNAALTEKFHYLLPRAAYFDKRMRGKHKNAVVVLTHQSSLVKLSLVGCKINGTLTRAFEVKSLRVNQWIHSKFNRTHDNVLVNCYDIPAHNNSNVFVVYRKPENELERISVGFEYPLFVPKERNSYSKVMVCTTAFDTPPHFARCMDTLSKDTIEVDMVHINAHESFLFSGVYNDSFLLESLHS